MVPGTPLREDDFVDRLFRAPTRFATILLCCLLSSCGFHLRGTIDLPSQLQPLAVSAEDINGELVTTLRQTLSAAGVAIDDNASYTLFILEEELERHRVSTSKSVFFDEYQLINQASFEIRDNSGRVVHGPKSVVTQTIFQEDENSPASKAEEERLLVSEMQTELALQMMRHLQSFARTGLTSATRKAESANETAR